MAESEPTKDAGIRFFTVCGGGPAGQLRALTKLPALVPPHKCGLTEATGSRYGCDGCGADGAAEDTRYTCADCDFDYCASCNEASKGGADPALLEPRMVFMHLDGGGAYFLPEQPGVTRESVLAFIAGVKSEKIPRQQADPAQ